MSIRPLLSTGIISTNYGRVKFVSSGTTHKSTEYIGDPSFAPSEARPHVNSAWPTLTSPSCRDKSRSTAVRRW